MAAEDWAVKWRRVEVRIERELRVLLGGFRRNDIVVKKNKVVFGEVNSADCSSYFDRVFV